ncbi:hypothetical protein HDU79_001731, partial [Rhizoclosmatium sp. JEL0117]
MSLEKKFGIKPSPNQIAGVASLVQPPPYSANSLSTASKQSTVPAKPSSLLADSAPFEMTPNTSSHGRTVGPESSVSLHELVWFKKDSKFYYI